MLPTIKKFEDKVITLIQGSSIQFVDFAVKLDLKRESIGEFAPQISNLSVARLEYDERKDIFFHPSQPGESIKPSVSAPIDQSLKLLADVWLPVPFFRLTPPRRFAEGPTNWARARIRELEEGEDNEGNTHWITIAFDTQVFDVLKNTSYLAPSKDDVSAGHVFSLAHRANEMGWFLELPWINSWLQEVFTEQAEARLGMQEDDIEDECKDFYYQAHYLNLLYILGTKLPDHEYKIITNTATDLEKPIPVDMVLDVGNSRTCGILIENHPQEKDTLHKRYELELRDLTQPAQVYSEPFESRIEFSQANFGKDHFSVQSGRSNAFMWPTIVRVGAEARRLASQRKGTEGSTGLSSPKRYLWDESNYEPGWRFNCAFVKSDSEPYATAAPVANLINEQGEALFAVPEAERLPVFRPHYSRSSVMTFMLSEVISQALMQINSPTQRNKMSHAQMPRHLRTIVLTVPPSMPKPEKEILRNRVEQALGIVWKSLGWHPEDEDLDDEGKAKAWPYFPEIHIQWDEATCGQVVYLFSEIQNNFAGRREEFFSTLARKDQQASTKLVVASIDIGGGTTDLVINDYGLDDDRSSNAFIVPEQRFRDGFKVAGDDILLEVIQLFVVPIISQRLKEAGIRDPQPLLSRLIGSEPVVVQEAVLRQQLALQILSPIGLEILAAYEKFDPVEPGNLGAITIADLLVDYELPTDRVLHYFNNAVVTHPESTVSEFNIMDLELPINLRKIHEAFLNGRFNICKTLKALSEIVYYYQCDVLLLTGRPSRLPGIQALLRVLLPVPVNRILPLHGYRAGGWYPFHKQGRIDDPKTTAAVGAMLCAMAPNLSQFFFRAAAFKAYSTVRYLGLIDNNNVLKNSNVFYENIDLDDPDYELPDQAFEVRGPMRLGFRQLGAERWGAAPLYTLSIEDDKVKRMLAEDGTVLKVCLRNERSRKGDSAGTEKFIIVSVESDSGAVKSKSLKLQLNTLTDAGLGETQYWLDSGSVIR
ncbi:MAG: virulence factor SrfB [Pseudomonadales bacterium]|nr:virulence factor SrfB [Pseudomonadales bacterium]